MLTSDAGQLEVTELEAWLDAECGCEMKHSVTACSWVVVALIVACDRSTRACQNSVTRKLKSMRSLDCAQCGKAAENCWRIIPI